MDFGVILLANHGVESFVPTNARQVPGLFAKTIVDNMIGYNDARGGEFDRTPMTISFYTERMAVFMIGKITEDLYDQVRRRVEFEINRRILSENGL